MTKLRDWFTDARRVAIQGFLATLGVLAVQVGIATEHQAGLILVMTGALLQLLQGLLALAFLRKSEAAVWFNTIGRGLVYGLAAAAAPVAVAVGLIDDGTSASLLTAVSTALTALSALIAVLNAQPTIPATTTDLSSSTWDAGALVAPATELRRDER